MIANLTTDAEIRAAKAEELPAFSGIKLLNIKRQLELLLELIGREQIFNEYTRHDITHIDQMLSMLDWMVPEKTKAIMTSSDWLMTVLAVYFHDFGMIVTSAEYEARKRSGFQEYRDNVLFYGDAGADYRAKVATMEPDKAERFLYQEFIRHKHAERIRAWILGQSREQLGISTQVVMEVDALLQPLDPSFRHDLALVCESHHLDDLEDVRKYPVRQPYGNSIAETVNVQFAAVLMRTVDLLHITRDRTPSISFRIISPTDPISQEEWAKQMAVISVRPQIAKNSEGNLDESAPRDTIEIHARFSQQDGFFALTSYLLYAESQIRKSSDWISKSNRSLATKHEFPWRKIDDSHIQTQGFLKDTFGFTIDEHRILNLLTGHTLYNDTQVVLRELVQNALDAVRLQRLIDERVGLTNNGEVTVRWSSKDRVLSVTDNGTGMTQSIIENNLLRVGASRYEDSDFKKEFPGFSAISRFGIGILSTFMIADSVEIITCHPDDTEARQLSLRSVHGKYLIRLLDKELDEDAKALVPHGTSLRLRIRHSAEIRDIAAIARRWIVVPECPVKVIVDDNEPVSVGFLSPKEAVENVLKQYDVNLSESDVLINKSVRVEQQEVDGVTLAFAVQWSEFFREWSFWLVPERSDQSTELFGTCVEGIRVESGTPGFKGARIAAIANARGVNAPRTNVARSGLEATPERDALLRVVYGIYCDHVRKEIVALHTKRAFSLTWATQEAKYLLMPLTEGGRKNFELQNSDLLAQQIDEIPVLVIEQNGKRSSVSPRSLKQERHFWTVDCESFRSAEKFLKETPAIASLSSVLSAVGAPSFGLPEAMILCDGNLTRENLLTKMAFTGKQVDRIILHHGERRVDLRWSPIEGSPLWLLTHPFVVSDLSTRLLQYRAKISTAEVDTCIAREPIDVQGLQNEVAIRAFGITYILHGTPLSSFLLEYYDSQIDDESDTSTILHSIKLALDNPGITFTPETLRRIVEMRLSLNRLNSQTTAKINIETFSNLLNEISGRVFDTRVWVRKEDDSGF